MGNLQPKILHLIQEQIDDETAKGIGLFGEFPENDDWLSDMLIVMIW